MSLPRASEKTSLFPADNAAVVSIVSTGQCKIDRAKHLIRCLSFFLDRWGGGGGVSLVCKHVLGVRNSGADALSHGNLPGLVPDADERPTTLPDNLLQRLVSRTPDWTKAD